MSPSAPEGREPLDSASQPDRPLRVALDLRLVNHSGIGTYLRGLLTGFAELEAPIEWTFIGPRCEVPSRLQVREWIEFGAPLYSLAEFRGYPSPDGVDLLHYPHYNLPLTRLKPRVVTLHDLFHLRYGSALKRAYQRFFLMRLAWTRAEVIAISAKTREELRLWSGVREQRITTISHGPGRVAPGRPAAASAVELAGGKTLKPPWFLAVGIDQPRKNMDFLISALALWYRRRPTAPPLVWTGTARKKLTRRIASVPADARAKIHVEPYAPDEQIEKLYAGAAGLIFPSLDEGFGLPTLEAMARGVPVLCARRRPMSDLLGDAPLWFDPSDSATLWRALDRVVDDPVLRDQVAENGLKQAAKFSWLKAARETYGVYCRAAGRDA